MKLTLFRSVVFGIWMFAQVKAGPPVSLKIDLENVVGYWDDGVEFAKLGSNITATAPSK